MIRIGMMVGDRYEVLERIGTGGMSDVYKAKDHKLNRHVAVKVLKQEFSENTNFVAKFRVEAQAAASLMHPNIVNVYDVGEENGIYYIVMELVEGITLKKYIEKKARLSFKEAVSIAIQACMGIEAAHNNHIIHRDIKPQNIIISKDGKVKVTDFGIAKAATSNTITSNVMGSVHYTSPEQARGGYSDEKSDIYSMGITLFEMLTGRVPFNGETTVAIAIKHIQEEMPSPREFVPEIPVCVEQIVLKCTQKSHDRRYRSMAELIADLKKALMTPDEDFVRIENPDESMATRPVTEKDRAEIKKQVKKREPVKDEMRLKKNSSNQPAKKKKPPVYQEEPEEEEEDDYDSDSRMERLTTILAVVGAVIIGCAVIFLVGRTVGIFDFSGQPGTKPPVIAENVPETGSENGENQGKGIPVPSVLGLLEADATATLKKSGFEVSKTDGYSEEIAKGKIMSQTPQGGSRAEAGTTVSIVISQGANMDNKILMPDILGLDPMDAISILTEAGLMIGEQKEMNDENANLFGKVCYASYTTGAPVEPGTTIDIGISVGPKEMTYSYKEQIPSPVDLDADYIDGTECKVTITGQNPITGAVTEYSSQTVRSFPISTNLRGMTDPAGLITYEFYVEGAAVNQTDANGNAVTVPGGKTQRVVQRQVFFTPEG